MKSLFKSRTFWANVISIGVIIVQALLDKAVIPLEYQGTFVALGNIALRMITTQPVSLFAKPKADIIRNPMGGK